MLWVCNTPQRLVLYECYRYLQVNQAAVRPVAVWECNHPNHAIGVPSARFNSVNYGVGPLVLGWSLDCLDTPVVSACRNLPRQDVRGHLAFQNQHCVTATSQGSQPINFAKSSRTSSATFSSPPISQGVNFVATRCCPIAADLRGSGPMAAPLRAALRREPPCRGHEPPGGAVPGSAPENTSESGTLTHVRSPAAAHVSALCGPRLTLPGDPRALQPHARC
eukprot:scaffold3055_cov402-Prasinococcus_capsulatus_cf.AAC.5